MPYDPAIHHRRSIRLKGHDYSQPGAYFVTLCAAEKACLFGDVVDGKMLVNRFGAIVEEEWIRSAEVRGEIELDLFTVMPNHFHAVVMLHPVNDRGTDNRGRMERTAPQRPSTRSLASLIGGFKSAVTRRIDQLRGTPRTPVWQRNYYEHVIRTEKSLEEIREYVANNPLRWELDVLYPRRGG